MLADDVGRRAHLVVVKLIGLGNQVGLHVLRAVEGVQAQHERLGCPPLLDRGHHVLPERDDALLREVIAAFVEYRVELDVCGLVDTRIGRVVWRAPLCCHAALVPPRVQLTVKELAGSAFVEEQARVVDAGLVEGRARHGRRAVKDEARPQAVGNVAVGRRAVRSRRVVATQCVVGHRRLLDIRAFLREEKGLRFDHLAREIESGEGDDGLAACGETVDGEARQAAVPAVNRVGIVDSGVLPQRVAGSAEIGALRRG